MSKCSNPHNLWNLGTGSLNNHVLWDGFVFPVLNNKTIQFKIFKVSFKSHFPPFLNIDRKPGGEYKIPSWKHISLPALPAASGKYHERAAICQQQLQARGTTSVSERDAGETGEGMLAACPPPDSKFLLTRLSINGQMAWALLAGEVR